MGKEAKRKRLQSLRPKKHTFVGRGYVNLKVTGIDDKGEESVENWELPLTTETMREVYQEYEARKPSPPVIERFVQPTEEAGKAVGLTEPKTLAIPNYADQRYLASAEEFEEERSWALAASVIDLPLYILDSGAPEGERLAVDRGERVTALKQLKLQGSHILELVRVAGRLCAWTEDERRRFFSMPSVLITSRGSEGENS